MVDLNSSERIIFGKHADERLNPCSTFKILNSMIALDSDAVRDENEILKWDGVVRTYPVWNRDHSMRTAIGVSSVWFYQELARRVGEKNMGEMVYRAGYGNMDTSQTLTNFWLGGGSLKISPNEQADFLERLVRNQLPFSLRSMTIAKDIMTLEKKEDYTMAGKTGSCGGIGWFVGFVEEGSNTRVFAFEIRGDGASGAEAKKIALHYLKGED
ncbi:MAG: penicillin-binding transpeptidase domain-containing protein [Sulfuricurvum sp.]